ncbi:MAG: YggS family pyridoxal phosphate-dependent enzyme [Mycobacteriaceae bacterium]|nr:YggS family pyridoxal phosphate-dependent enzyme [Mycobacteriaceae bacterium]
MTPIMADFSFHTDRESQLAQALTQLRSRLEAAAAAANRNIAEIELLPITKFFPATDVAILARLGLRAFGESRDQEAVAKVAEVARLLGSASPTLDWHMVGQVQRNKARSVARWAHTVYSVDTPRLVAALDQAAGAALADGHRSHPMRVYVQVSLDGDASRAGVDVSMPAAIERICAQIEAAEALELVGLMGVPPLGWDPDAAFAVLESEHQRVLGLHPGALSLSTGMSDDLESAIRHGSTCVRVGSALLGIRQLPSPDKSL